MPWLEIGSVSLRTDLARRNMGRVVLLYGAVREEVASGMLRARPIIALV